MDSYLARIVWAIAQLAGNQDAQPADFLPSWRVDPRLANPAEFYERKMAEMEQPG